MCTYTASIGTGWLEEVGVVWCIVTTLTLGELRSFRFQVGELRDGDQ